jgi:hypothetical protein
MVPICALSPEVGYALTNEETRTAELFYRIGTSSRIIKFTLPTLVGSTLCSVYDLNY